MGEQEIRALDEVRGFVDLSSWRKVLVTGADAAAWLEDIVTNRVADLWTGRTRRALLLDRTGHVRADFGVARMVDGFLLIQDPVQPRAVDELLGKYVLSSDVELADRTDELALVAQPGVGAVAFTGGTPAWGPSVLGTGIDWIVGREELGEVRDHLRASSEASPQDLEVWRIRRGVPRFGIDFGDESLPQEAGLDDVVDATKGCFVGQEAVAKVRNLGHAPWVIRAYRSEQAVQPGEALLAGDDHAGRVTSVAPLGDGSYSILARVRWDARDAELHADAGAPVALRAS